MCVKPNTEDLLKLEVQNILKRVQCIVYIRRSNFKWKHSGQNHKQKRSKVLSSLLLTGDKRILWNEKTLTETFGCYGKTVRLFKEEHVNKRTNNLSEGPYLQQLYPSWLQCQLIPLPSTQHWHYFDVLTCAPSHRNINPTLSFFPRTLHILLRA